MTVIWLWNISEEVDQINHSGMWLTSSDRAGRESRIRKTAHEKFGWDCLGPSVGKHTPDTSETAEWDEGVSLIQVRQHLGLYLKVTSILGLVEESRDCARTGKSDVAPIHFFFFFSGTTEIYFSTFPPLWQIISTLANRPDQLKTRLVSTGTLGIIVQ